MSGRAPDALKTTAALVTLTALFAAMAFASWRAWGDPVADFPKQLYMAWRIGAGDLLYRDIRHFYGPLSQLFNGGVFAVFGTSYVTLATANLLIAYALTLLLYAICARYVDRLTGFVAAAAFILVHVFQQLGGNASNNFIGPYSHEATHGTLLLFLLIALATPPRKSFTASPWLAQGVTLGALALTKPELVLAAAAVSFTALLLELRQRHASVASLARVAAVLCTGAVIPLTLSGLYFRFVGGASLAEAAGWTFGAVTPLWSAAAHMNPIYGQISGLSVLGETGPLIAKAAAVVFGVGAGAVCIDLLAGDRLRPVLGLAYLGFVTALLYLSGAAVPTYNYSYALPLVSTLGVILVIALARRSEPAAQLRLGLFVGVAAVASALKIYLNATFWWMGFSLLVPSTAFLVVLGMGIIPGLLRTLRPKAFVLRWTTLIVVAAMSLHVALGSIFTHALKTLALGEGADRFYVLGTTHESQLMHEIVRRLSATTEPQSTLMLFPGGVLANYLLRRTNPTPFVANLGSRTWYEYGGGSTAITAALEATPPDYIVYMHTPPQFPGPVYQIWGPEGFANELIDWIARHYDEVDRIGPPSQNFGELVYVLLKRRTAALAPG